MLNLTKSTFPALLTVFTWAFFSLSGCQKESAAVHSESAGQFDVESLARLAIKEDPSDAELQTVDEGYAKLTPEEIEDFFSYQLALEQAQLPEAEKSSEEEIAAITASRKMVFDASLEVFGVPVNQISNDQLGELLARQEEDAEGLRASCPRYRFNASACESNNGSVPCERNTKVKVNSTNFCQYEFWFKTSGKKVYGATWAAKQMLRTFGRCKIPHRSQSTSTGTFRTIPIKGGIVRHFLGSATNAKKRLKMRR